MAAESHRPAPDLLPGDQAGIRAFEGYFRPSGVPRMIPSVGGRTASFFAVSVGAYARFFRRERNQFLGRIEQRAPWVEDTLVAPDEVWSRTENGFTTEIFLTRYELATGERFYFAVICRRAESAEPWVIEPRGVEAFKSKSDAEWDRIGRGAALVWPEQTDDAEEPVTNAWLVSVCFGPRDEYADADSWIRRFRELEVEHRVSITEAFVEHSSFPPAQGSDYWVLDLNTTPSHKDFGFGFGQAARKARAHKILAASPSEVCVKARKGRGALYLAHINH